MVSECSAVKRRGYVELLRLEDGLYAFASEADKRVAWMCDGISSMSVSWLDRDGARAMRDAVMHAMKLAVNVTA
jgi:hypothetical protein